ARDRASRPNRLPPVDDDTIANADGAGRQDPSQGTAAPLEPLPEAEADLLHPVAGAGRLGDLEQHGSERESRPRGERIDADPADCDVLLDLAGDEVEGLEYFGVLEQDLFDGVGTSMGV